MKLLAALCIILITLIGGVIPLFVGQKPSRRDWLVASEYFARGVFLGAGLLHALPEAVRTLADTGYQRSIQMPFLICALTLVGLTLIEKYCLRAFDTLARWMPYWRSMTIALLLSIHSLIAGLALGGQVAVSGFILLFMAIFAHKAADAFVLTVSLANRGIQTSTTLVVLFVFSLMTPLGIALGNTLIHLTVAGASHWVSVFFNAMTAGTFLYIASVDNLCLEHDNKLACRRTHAVLLILGFALMALLALWI